ncbi:hypothetical protein TVAG_419600 [Trichomonas vaginalis G3]|uniref:Uncharacterized protein n=1 Tax=Trichomonas vaginalis (strain ATCC PRA-98 / G3) TaxID=412133 RepID=A2EIT4_TRIV3|nr:transcriptional regulator TrmB middle phospholipase D-like domain-containing protein [Trichomonas vaginalis G3]EAY07418.1 hypothetical protein TVAG_419600 [Trichomonas vaginalis G3]KAI5484628.1 transcriptional regulator TrmB middle phospholipase D-like domain-containing protein [Trichomonas vaginalis G3]|eukprot:XP_001319641.1 hypothetical protein [Trichomonas vaginalis G3]
MNIKITRYIFAGSIFLFGIVLLILSVIFERPKVENDEAQTVEYLDDFQFNAKLNKCVQDAQKSIYIICKNLTASPELKKNLEAAIKRNVKLNIIAEYCSPIDGYTPPKQDFSKSYENGISSSLIIFDSDKALIPSMELSHQNSQTALYFEKAPSLINDLRNFYNLGEYYGSGKDNDRVWPDKLLVHYNYYQPHKFNLDGGIGNLSFAQSGTKIPPVRDSHYQPFKDVINSSDEQEILVSTQRFIQNQSHTPHFTLQNQLIKCAARNNNTKIKILVSIHDLDINFNQTLRWVSSVCSMKNIAARITSEKHIPSYVVVGNHSFIFSSYPLSDILFDNSYGFTVIGRNFSKIADAMRKEFYKVYDKSENFTCWLDRIWDDIKINHSDTCLF